MGREEVVGKEGGREERAGKEYVALKSGKTSRRRR
jgi:hypothetical protein